MLELHRWWIDRPEECFWLEVTDRSDPGTNLKAPQRNETGGEFWSYALVLEVRAGDIVFHYDRPSQRIIGMSRATGDMWDDDIVWGARGTYAREAGVSPHSRTGWYAGLTGFETLTNAISLDAIRQRADAIRGGLDTLALEVGSPLYFPFERGKNRPIRPLQGYLFRFPAFFVSLVPGLSRVASPEGRQRVPPITVPDKIGSDYRRADEELSIGAFDPMAVDPSVVERGTRGHAATQNALADYLAERGVIPRSPRADEPSFDLAWERDRMVFVAEVKSITNRNEERQLRMGLGQVLQYRYLLSQTLVREVVPVLALERKPPAEWLSLCDSLGVRLVWTGDISGLDV